MALTPYGLNAKISVVKNTATLLISTKDLLDDGSIIQIRVWSVPVPVRASSHLYKYSLFYGRNGQRLVGYDNEAGKGDHKHVRGVELPVTYNGLSDLLDQFQADVAALRKEET
ncbi:DUF6516 family protein [Azospirillum sp. SYSU D00513]|uniref:toxin-antitoxin system TumE family protein n=1 Tax=Azospirillum sp. SYSU D00513 TaxID=2812561 RepID=UPI001A97C6DF|nr:DUF6516 family protein [Azospirillum sp. SYSU D00513]